MTSWRDSGSVLKKILPASVTYITGRGGSLVDCNVRACDEGRQVLCRIHNQSTRRNIPAVDLGIIRPVSLTNGIDLQADWEGDVHPVNFSSSFKSAIAEKLRSQRTARWGDSNIHCCAYHCYNISRNKFAERWSN